MKLATIAERFVNNRCGLPFLIAVYAMRLFVLEASDAHAQASLAATGKGAGVAHDLYLSVTIDHHRTPLIVRFREQDGHLFIKGKDLNTIGVKTDVLDIHDDAEVSLESIQGLSYQYDPSSQTVDLKFSDQIHKRYSIDTREPVQIPAASSSRGLLINYDAFAQTDAAGQLALWNELRYFDPNGTLSSTGITQVYSGQSRYLRYDTSWSVSRPQTLTTMQFGDTISSSLDWSRSVRMGGFQWRSNFAIRPDLVTFPVPSISGSAVVPSSVDLYINGIRQYSGTVPNGPFLLNNVPGITGGGQATVITRDALGRTISTSVPIYVDTRMLASGLSSYSFEVGFLRRSYGINSFDYSSRPATSGSVRHGISDALTLEGHAEATSGLYNVGAGVLVRLGMAGVLSSSLSASTGHLAGTQLGLGYQLIQPLFSINMQTLRAYGRYGDLAARDGTPVSSATDLATLSFPFMKRQTLSISYTGYRFQQVPVSNIGSMSYSISFGNLASMTLSAFRDFRQHSTQGIFVGLNLGLGNNVSVNSSAGRQNGQSNYAVNATRPPDYDGGWGWGVQAGGAGSADYQQVQTQYIGRYGETTAVAQNADGHTTGSLDVNGSIVLMDGAVRPARRISDGFALVSTNGVAGIPVLHDNRPIGLTDGSGYLLVPDLNSYQRNQLSIDSTKLPVDARIASTSMDLVPKSGSGVLAEFSISRYSAATVVLQGPDGKVLPPGTPVHHEESGRDTVVGYDGLTFIDHLQRDNHLMIVRGALHCTTDFTYERPQNNSLPTLGPFVCHPVHGDAP